MTDPTETTEIKPVIDASNPEIQALIEQAVSGLKAKNSELLGKNKELAEIRKQYDGVDPDEYRRLKAFIDQSEEAKLLAEGKTDEVFNRRTEKLRAELEAKTRIEAEAAQTWQQKADAYKAQVEQLKIDDVVTRAMIKVGALEGADEDARLLARQLFKLEEDGIVGRDSKGNLLTGKNGALTLDEWVDQLKDKKPHWFGRAQGVGAKGSSGTVSSAGTDAKKLAGNPKERADYIKGRFPELSNN